MNQGAVEGLSKSKRPEKLSDKFLKAVRHSNEVFSAFKVHAMGKAMQAKLLDRKGKLRPFEDWKKLVAPIASHHTGAWLRTEYNTAVIRAHQGADWQDFIANKDVLPNLRWMPTTSPTPEGTHKTFWERRLTLPVDDPFWATQHPGNRWNCKCSLDATDDPISDNAGDFREGTEPTAQRGLGTNPKNGTLIDDKHPYFPEKCNACPYYQKSRKGIKGMLKALFENKKKDCSRCPYIDSELAKAKLKEQYPEDKWEHTFISENGGYVVTEKARIAETNDKHGKPDKNEVEVFKKEQTMAKDLASLGNKIEHLAEKDRPIDQRYDVHFNGVKADLKSTKSANNIIKYAKKAFQTQGADMVIIRFEQRCSGIEDEFKGVRRRFPNKRILYYFEDEKVLHEYP